VWTKANATPPKLIVNHAIAVGTEVSEPNVQPDNEYQERQKEEQRKWLMPHKQSGNEKSAEDHTCSDADATMPKTLFVGGSSCPNPNPAGDSKRDPRDHEHWEVWCHRVARHTPNEAKLSDRHRERARLRVRVI
jgi:hypothetical protein